MDDLSYREGDVRWRCSTWEGGGTAFCTGKRLPEIRHTARLSGDRQERLLAQSGRNDAFLRCGFLVLVMARSSREIMVLDFKPHQRGVLMFSIRMTSQFQFHRTTVEPEIAVFELAGEPTEEQWLRSMRHAELFLKEVESRGQSSWAVVVDPSQLYRVDARMRRLIGEWRAENMALIANTCVCACYVAESAWLRGAITAVMWFAKPVIPVSTKATREEAISWVEQKRAEILSF